MEIDKVWIACIQYKTGIILYPCATEELAKEEVYKYVRSWWHELVERGIAGFIPESKQEAIEFYFDNNEYESFFISEGPLITK